MDHRGLDIFYQRERVSMEGWNFNESERERERFRKRRKKRWERPETEDERERERERLNSDTGKCRSYNDINAEKG